MHPIDLAPPLSDNEGNEERNAGLGGHNHDEIQQSIAAGEGINPLRDSLIHLYRSLTLHKWFTGGMLERTPYPPDF
jgi:hypothetical protein